MPRLEEAEAFSGATTRFGGSKPKSNPREHANPTTKIGSTTKTGSLKWVVHAPIPQDGIPLVLTHGHLWKAAQCRSGVLQSDSWGSPVQLGRGMVQTGWFHIASSVGLYAICQNLVILAVRNKAAETFFPDTTACLLDTKALCAEP